VDVCKVSNCFFSGPNAAVNTAIVKVLIFRLSLTADPTAPPARSAIGRKPPPTRLLPRTKPGHRFTPRQQGSSVMASDESSFDSGDLADQLASLRAQIEALTEERIRPAVTDAANQIRQQTDALADRVRDQPIAAVAIAFGIGFLLGRAMR
jgi:ElaB/YqjD/DUF883 family membrane-anchored ribosome-binding protein